MATNVTCDGRSLEGIIRGSNFRISFSKDTDNSAGDSSDRGLVQSFQLQFQRQLRRVYDLATPSFYYLEGAPNGQVSFSRIVGPKGLPSLACDCQPQTVLLDAGPSFCYPEELGTAATAYELRNALPFGIAGQGDSQNFLIAFQVSYLFSDLRLV